MLPLALAMLMMTTAETLPPPEAKTMPATAKHSPATVKHAPPTAKHALARSRVVEKPQARVLQPQRRPPQKPTVTRKTYPPIELYEVNLNETLRFKPYDDRGRPRKAALAELTKFMRCHHTGKQHRVDPRLIGALYTIGRHFPGKRIEVYSGYRPKQFCDRAHSRHLTASAVDFHIDGVQNEALIAWLRSTFHPAGVGYYPNGVHVHFDLDRAHDTYWVDAGDSPVDEPANDAVGELLRHDAGPTIAPPSETPPPALPAAPPATEDDDALSDDPHFID